MIWLASYPRSGNTFFRIVLSEVYGIESSTFHHESDYPVDPIIPISHRQNAPTSTSTRQQP